MREKTLKILCVCQVGVGSSVMLRVFVGKALDAMGVKDSNIEVCDATTAGGQARFCDLIMTNFEVAPLMERTGKPVIALMNMTSKKEISQKLEIFLAGWGK